MYDDFICKVEELRQKNAAFATATVVRREAPSSGKSGDKAVIDKWGTVTGWVGGGCVQAIIRKEAQEAIMTGKARLVKVGRGDQAPQSLQEGVVEYRMTCLSEGAVDVFIEPVLPAPHLVVMGSSAIARALVKIGKIAGYRVSVVAPDARPDTFDHPDELVTQLDMKKVRVSADLPFIVVCTQGEQDELALEQALSVDSAYLAFVASRKKKEALFAALQQTGVPAQRLAEVKCPAGLDIGAKLPEEVAVSILAEIIMTGRRLPAPAAQAPVEDASAYYINPVCGVPVDIRQPKHVVEYRGELVYFCCDGCKVQFEAAPERYIPGNINSRL